MFISSPTTLHLTVWWNVCFRRKESNLFDEMRRAHFKCFSKYPSQLFPLFETIYTTFHVPISLHSPPTHRRSPHPASTTVQTHIRLLHTYNETRDIASGLMGIIADNRGVRARDIYEEYDVQEAS